MAARSTAPTPTSSLPVKSRAAGRPWRSFEFLKREAPGFANAYIVDMPPQIGIRETRRWPALSTHRRGCDLAARDFPDTIGVNGWPIEKHVAGDVEWRVAGRFRSRAASTTCPTGCWCHGSVRNLLVAGRCASMTHEGQSAARVSGACFVMGEGRRLPPPIWRLPAIPALAEIPVEALQAFA